MRNGIWALINKRPGRAGPRMKDFFLTISFVLDMREPRRLDQLRTQSDATSQCNPRGHKKTKQTQIASKKKN